MARIRSIKPEFFFHEQLAELSAMHRLFFIGLWTLADKDGRLEDRPKRIKASVFPWDECDVEAMLEDLDRGGFIQRYVANGKACIAIPEFSEHQRPHPKETSFNLPPPPKEAEPGKNTASREISRQEIKDPTPFPSSPAGNGDGDGILDNGTLVVGDGEMVPGKNPAPPVSLARQPTGFAHRYETPTTPRESWGGIEFFAWAQNIRVKNKFAPEDPYDERKLSTWWSKCLMGGATPEDMCRGFLAFGQSDYWESRGFLFKDFAKHWVEFTRLEGIHAAQG